MLIEAKSCSDAASMRTTVVLQSDEYVAKVFITYNERRNILIPWRTTCLHGMECRPCDGGSPLQRNRRDGSLAGRYRLSQL
jgi:hypothetical protein